LAAFDKIKWQRFLRRFALNSSWAKRPPIKSGGVGSGGRREKWG